jgi:Uma2 family endonuclease
MASELVSHEIPQILPPELCPDVEHLVTEDDTPVDNFFSEKQQRLLAESLYDSPSWARGRRFVALSNVGLFYAIRQPPYVPDMMLALDVAFPEDPWPKSHRSYFVWEYGKAPEVVVEVVSNEKGGEASTKLSGYASVGVRYYVIYDPQQLLSDQPLRAFQLTATRYEPLAEPLWLADVQLGPHIWQGRFEGYEMAWLRWTDATGDLLLTGGELAQQQRLRAERLAEQLRRAGLEPEA